MEVVAVIPAFNADQTVGQVVRGVRAAGLDVIVVDDGSKDRTAAEAGEAGAHVLSHAVNRGKGSALTTGFRHAMLDDTSVLTIDADLQHDPAEIPRFIDLADRADLVIGHRRLDSAHMPSVSLLGNRVSSYFVGLFCGEPVPDSQCGFRLYSHELLARMTLHDRLDERFESETVWLMQALRGGLSVRWVPIRTIYPTGVNGQVQRFSNFDVLPDTLRVIRAVLRERLS